jgi:hypothetical protein
MELDTSAIQKVFNVTAMTVYNWRNGTDKKKVSSLPFHTRKVGTRHRIYFKWVEVKNWALQNSVPVVVHPSNLKKAKVVKCK